MKVIIETITPYKEKDAIINAITKDQVISFTIKSIYSERSQNKILNVPLTVFDAEIEKGKLKYPILKSYSDVVSPMISDASLEYYTSINIVNEVLKKLLPDEDKPLIFDDTVEFVNELKNAKNYFVYVLYYLNKIFKIAGYGFEVNHCVCCGTKEGIAAFSFQEGGFICKNCLSSEHKIDLNPEQMKLLRNIYITKDLKSLNDINFNSNDVEHLLNLYFAYIFDNFGIQLNSFKTL